MSQPPRRACVEWPRIVSPAPGCLPPVAPMRDWERVLHIALRSAIDQQHGLTRALRSCGSVYRDVDWRAYAGGVNGSFVDSPLLEAVFKAAAEITPTLVWMQLHGGDVPTPEDIIRLRKLCDPRLGVIINWDGDQHFEPQQHQREWFVRLGRVCDASLVVNTRHPAEYAAMHVFHPGFWGVGYDEYVWLPVEPRPTNVPEVVFLANYWHWLASEYSNRWHLAQAVADAFPGRFGVYGNQTAPYPGRMPFRPFLPNEHEAHVYSGAVCALSISIRNDLPRYTSNRLVYLLGCGALPVVERFPDMTGLGLEEGVNCLGFTGPEELVKACRWALDEATLAERDAIRAAAYEVGKLHSWQAHVPELLAIVDAIRAERGVDVRAYGGGLC